MHVHGWARAMRRSSSPPFVFLGACRNKALEVTWAGCATGFWRCCAVVAVVAAHGFIPSSGWPPHSSYFLPCTTR
eukprot:scaffold118545_cov50-Phaeocystis_antarctica.AAC.1